MSVLSSYLELLRAREHEQRVLAEVHTYKLWLLAQFGVL
jgi:hypothetical protein